MLPETLKLSLQAQLQAVKHLHERDLASGHGEGSLPITLAVSRYCSDGSTRSPDHSRGSKQRDSHGQPTFRYNLSHYHQPHPIVM